ncbi:MAG: DoxX family protein [Gemmatimonadaceae bacterium]|nr:DoxX family protein [Gemmatimonadaceae bacterium]
MSAAPFTDTTATSRSSAGGSTKSRWAGRILTGIAVLFLTFDLAMKLAGAEVAVDGTVKLGWQPHHLPILGGLQLVCLVLYLIPRTAPLGAVLWTGYLGGAVATHLRVDDPLFSRTLFPIYVAALIWGGLYLRDARVREALRPAR